MRQVSAIAALMVLGVCGTLQSQDRGWGIAPEIGFSHFSGSSADDTSLSFRPSPSTSVGVRLDASLHGFVIAVAVLYEETGLMENGPSLAITAHNTVKLLAIHPEVSLRLLGLGTAQLRLHGGVAINRWSIVDEKARTRLGGLGGLSVEAPIGARTTLQVRWEGSLSRSIFDEGDLPAEFKPRSTFHSRLGLGFRLGL